MFGDGPIPFCGSSCSVFFTFVLFFLIIALYGQDARKIRNCRSLLHCFGLVSAAWWCSSLLYNKYESAIIYNQTKQLTAKIKILIIYMADHLIPQTISQHQGLSAYLNEHYPDYNGQETNLVQVVLSLLQQKDRTIKALQEHTVKYKAEQMKNNKLISQLQDKIAQLSPNNNNTGSTFMMASQFKDYFDDFMKNCLPVCLSPILPFPQAYAQFSSTIFNGVYQSIDNFINDKLGKICKILQIQPDLTNVQTVRNCLLKLMQDNWQKILNIYQNSDLKKSSPFIDNITKFSNQQINQIVESDQFLELDEKIVKICSYMILQQKKWSFILPNQLTHQNQQSVCKFSKKDFTCIDGWIKQKQDALIILQGLKRCGDDGNVTRHANLKNYVIPYVKSEDNQLKLVKIKENTLNLVNQEKQHKQTFIQSMIDKSCQCQISSYNEITTEKQALKFVDENRTKQNKQNEPSNEINVIRLQKQKRSIKSDINSKSQKSIKYQQANQQFNQYKYSRQKIQNIETAIRKLAKVEEKLTNHYIDEVSLVFPVTQHVTVPEKSHNDDKNGKQYQIINESLMPSMTRSSKLKNNCKVSHNLISDPSFEQILTLPQRKKDISDQLPLKRDSSRTKKSNSRKTSAGKIVVQAVDSKQNMLNRYNKEHSIKQCNKQNMYKDMIKLKLGADHKTEREKTKQNKQCKNKNKDEDRPLRIMHFKKIREKYLNL